MPLFSIIIPTKDRSSLLKEAIESVLAQNYGDFEVIVVDDHSTEDILSLVNNFNDDRLRYTKNKGIERSAARNTGIEASKGEYICFLDDDDKYGPDYLSDFYKWYEAKGFPNDVILRTGFVKEYENGRKKYGVNYDEKKHDNAAKFAAFNMCGVWSLCIPRQMLIKDLFDERWPHWQDTHLILRLLGKARFTQLPSYQYNYRIHTDMGSQQALQKEIVLHRAEINVAAIKDFFESYEDISKKYLPTYSKAFLSAEKYLQYAANAIKADRKTGFDLLKRSMNEGVFWRMWKGYVVLFKNLLFN